MREGHGRDRGGAGAAWCTQALEACDELASEGISVEVIDPRTVAPLDVETIRASVAKTGRLLIVDEAFAPFGVGAEIAAQVADRGFDELQGIHLVGGGAMLRGFDQRLAEETELPVHLVEAPLECVVLGAGKCLEAFDSLKVLFMGAESVVAAYRFGCSYPPIGG